MQPAPLVLSTGEQKALRAGETLGSQKCITDLKGTFQAKGVNIQLEERLQESREPERTEEEIEQQTPSECINCKPEMRLAKTQAEIQLANAVGFVF